MRALFGFCEAPQWWPDVLYAIGGCSEIAARERIKGDVMRGFCRWDILWSWDIRAAGEVEQWGSACVIQTRRVVAVLVADGVPF